MPAACPTSPEPKGWRTVRRIGGSGRVGRRGVAGPPGAFVAESGVAAAVACVGAGRRSSPALNVSHASDSDVGAVRPAGSGSDGR